MLCFYIIGRCWNLWRSITTAKPQWRLVFTRTKHSFSHTIRFQRRALIQKFGRGLKPNESIWRWSLDKRTVFTVNIIAWFLSFFFFFWFYDQSKIIFRPKNHIWAINLNKYQLLNEILFVICIAIAPSTDGNRLLLFYDDFNSSKIGMLNYICKHKLITLSSQYI